MVIQNNVQKSLVSPSVAKRTSTISHDLRLIYMTFCWSKTV